MTTIAEPTPSGRAAPTPLARLDVSGGGDIACVTPFGCEATISFLPVADAAATLDPEWLPGHAGRFEVEPSVGSAWMVVGPVDAPAALAPGAYLVVGAIATISDLASEAPDASGAVFPVIGSTECVEPLVVDDETSLVRVAVGFDRDTCRLSIGKTPDASLVCTSDSPWSGIALGGIPGMTATSLDQSRIDLRNATDQAYSYRVNTWAWWPPGTCDELDGQEVVRGRIGAGDTLRLEVDVPFEVPVTIAFWEGRCGEACDADPFTAMLVERSTVRPIATD